MSRPFDIIVWGATGFTGRLVAKYLAEKKESGKEQFRFAIAGRNRKRLDEIRAELVGQFPSSKEVAVLVGDAFDQKSVDAVVSQTRVLLSTAGPYTLFGLPVVDACVRFGTHYCDITGELNFVKTVQERYGEEAARKGVHLVSTCGFDCIPSDLGVLHTVLKARQQGLDELHFVRGYAKIKGAASGGTMNSVLTIMEQPASVLKEMAHPYSMIPAGSRPATTSMESEPKFVGYCSELSRFTFPFPLATGDMRIVRKSAHHLRYGSDFHYSEVAVGSGPVKGLFGAVAAFFFLVIGLLAVSVSFTRNLVRRIVPQPGEGPSQKTMDEGFFKLNFFGVTRTGQKIQSSISGGEPGYKETSRMVAESALCLAFDSLTSKGGVETPAMAMGEKLIPRLQSFGIKFE